jgi:DNA-directed RNA polymerase specialized sigma24 family protein
LVDLIVRYLNNRTVLDDLRRAREELLSPAEEDEPELGGDLRASGPPRAVARRLTAEGVQAVVDGYRAGETARELAERFSISESSVKRLVRQAGCRKRRVPTN